MAAEWTIFLWTIPAVREKLDVSRTTVQAILAEMRRHPERYGPKDIPHRRSRTWVDEDALIDWLAYGEAIDAGMEVPEREARR